jgi:hypothetical protein
MHMYASCRSATALGRYLAPARAARIREPGETQLRVTLRHEAGESENSARND